MELRTSALVDTGGIRTFGFPYIRMFFGFQLHMAHSSQTDVQRHGVYIGRGGIAHSPEQPKELGSRSTLTGKWPLRFTKKTRFTTRRMSVG